MSIAQPPELEIGEASLGGRPLGVYIHFPWCHSKCPYCDFFSVATRDAIPHDRYADAVIAEFDRRIEELEPTSLRSVYFGGGTPSLWEDAALGRVINHIFAKFDLHGRDVEITLECNPSSFDAGRCRNWRNLGINRLSLGLQSLNDSDLQYLGRAHDAKEGLAALDAALASGIPFICADLIFGLPGRMPKDALREIRQLPLTALSHLSVYALTIEQNTPFGALTRAGRLAIAPDDCVADTFVALHQELSMAGFEHYEISNYAQRGHRSVHNTGYWKGCDYLGLGVAAWGTVHVRKSCSVSLNEGQRLRYRNTTRTQQYMELCSNNLADSQWQIFPAGILAERELIDKGTAMIERLMLGLRTKEGISLDNLAEEFDVDHWLFRRNGAIEKLIVQGRLMRDGSILCIPYDAWFLADGTICELI
jgi:oxygen-independent coproporphyrinogen-3 oxidase